MEMTQIVFGPPPNEMSEQLQAALTQAGLSFEVLHALRLAMHHAQDDPNAFAYAHGMTRAFLAYGVDGVKHQVLYLLINLDRWRGPTARATKAILRKWTDLGTK
jgi:hypothetical protein